MAEIEHREESSKCKIDFFFFFLPWFHDLMCLFFFFYFNWDKYLPFFFFFYFFPMLRRVERYPEWLQLQASGCMQDFYLSIHIILWNLIILIFLSIPMFNWYYVRITFGKKMMEEVFGIWNVVVGISQNDVKSLTLENKWHKMIRKDHSDLWVLRDAVKFYSWSSAS